MSDCFDRSLSQLEKLLQKNYFLHQSARDGFRSYLQAYASYSLKKIFDINQLDLIRVGKSFGFAVPPRVNVSIGGGQAPPEKKRKRSTVNEEWEDMPIGEGAESDDETNAIREEHSKPASRHKDRRVEAIGSKMVGRKTDRKERKG